jgi:hypothetical protein
MKSQPDRIHYIVTTQDAKERRLHTPNDSALGRVLDAALVAQGYTGPASAGDDDESGALPTED